MTALTDKLIEDVLAAHKDVLNIIDGLRADESREEIVLLRTREDLGTQIAMKRKLDMIYENLTGSPLPE
jgi:hypothetical protein